MVRSIPPGNSKLRRPGRLDRLGRRGAADPWMWQAHDMEEVWLVGGDWNIFYWESVCIVLLLCLMYLFLVGGLEYFFYFPIFWE